MTTTNIRIDELTKTYKHTRKMIVISISTAALLTSGFVLVMCLLIGNKIFGFLVVLIPCAIFLGFALLLNELTYRLHLHALTENR